LLDINKWHQNGFTSYVSLSLQKIIENLQSEMHKLASVYAKYHSIPIKVDASLEKILEQIAKYDRSLLATIYDAVKFLPAFHQFYSSSELINCIKKLLNTDMALLHKDSVGIRIDLHQETRNLTNIHQEFHSFPFALNSLVIWCPLTSVNRYKG
jgi:hypothetical protein